jgi:hypothetical protein
VKALQRMWAYCPHQALQSNMSICLHPSCLLASRGLLLKHKLN